MDPPTIQHDPAARRFTVELDGHQAGLDYSLHGDRLSIDHTLVPEAIGGRGVAGRLVQVAMEYARAQGLGVVPACAYARAWIQRHPEYAALCA
ncbi:MAG: GNAT family N-acetyltransferase [Pseudoxanthomonas sp.]